MTNSGMWMRRFRWLLRSNFVCRWVLPLESGIPDSQCRPCRTVWLGDCRKIYWLDCYADYGISNLYHGTSIAQISKYRFNVWEYEAMRKFLNQTDTKNDWNMTHRCRVQFDMIKVYEILNYKWKKEAVRWGMCGWMNICLEKQVWRRLMRTVYAHRSLWWWTCNDCSYGSVYPGTRLRKWLFRDENAPWNLFVRCKACRSGEVKDCYKTSD